MAHPLVLSNESPYPQQDALLAEICRALQIDVGRQARAAKEYDEVTRWLNRTGGRFASVDTTVYPQGSTALGTTNPPHGGKGVKGDAAEYDLDAVVEIVRWQQSPVALLETLYDDLAANPRYERVIERKTRCVRLDFPNDFHLDLLPARADHAGGGTRIEIPDRELLCWLSSDPKAYAAWFHRRSDLRQQELTKASVEPLPDHLSADEKPPLARIVQLAKRRRDLRFNSSNSAPRSVVLTTLIANAYTGAPGLLAPLMASFDAIVTHATAVAPQIMHVPNPVNPDEDFSDRWRSDLAGRRAYDQFVQFATDFLAELRAFAATQGLENLRDRLAPLFGEAATLTAIRKYSERLAKASALGAVRSVGPAIVIGGERGTRVRPHEYFGR